MLVCANLTMQFGGKPLFENVSVKFEDGARYGLIGANGCGKSTLMKILSHQLEPSSGTVTVGPEQRVGVLGQDQFAFEEFSVQDTVMMGHKELWEIMQERARIYSLPEMSTEDGIKVAELEVRFAELDGYSAESRAGELLLGLDISLEWHTRLMNDLAPGLKLRVLLAQVLFAEPDIMLLDEPTNNLDIDTIRWLENILIQRRVLMIIISHDRHFLNSVCTQMADLDYGELRLFPGNYDEYMTAATRAREKLIAENARKEAKVKELKSFVSRFSANASKAKQATSRMRQIEKMDLIEIKPSSRRSPYIRFEQEKKLFRLALEAVNISNGYDQLLFNELSFDLEVGQRLAVIGPNGIGKTTLLKTLLDELPTQSGTIKWSENHKIGYYPQQHQAQFQQDMNLLQWMSQWGQSGDDEQVIRGVLGKMLFSGQDVVNKKVSVLSGGERGRMLFGKLMLQRPNILVMDEPTNHMDMETIEALNLALENYPGTLIFVSHDRQFVSSLATQLLVLSSQDVVHYRGDYESYLTKLESDHS